jgi:hypothetical protein
MQAKPAFVWRGRQVREIRQVCVTTYSEESGLEPFPDKLERI